MFVWNYNIYMLPFLISVMITLSLIFIGWQRRHVTGGWPFLFLLMTVLIYCLGYTLELGSQNVPTLILFAKFEYLGIALMPAGWLWLALTLTNQNQWLTSRRFLALCLIPIVTILLAWTNEFHGLIWQTIQINFVNGLGAWHSSYGFWFIIHLVYFHTITLVGVLLLLQRIKRSHGLYRWQVTAVLLALLFPWLTSIIYFLKVISVPINPTTFAFAIGGICVAWAIWRYQFLDLVPVARDTVIEIMPDGVIVLDTYGRIVDMNPAAKQITHTQAKKQAGLPITAVLPVIDPCFTSRLENQESHIELTLNGKNGKSHTFDCQITPLPNRGTHLTGSVIILKDVTKRKETEEMLTGAREAAENARHEAEAASRAKSTFLSNMSHELRTPLTIISLYADILKKLARSRKQDDFLPRLEQIHFSARHLSAIVEDILNFSKIEAGMMELHEEMFDVHNLIEEIEMMAQPLMIKNANRFQVQCAQDIHYLEADKTKLRQILLNLVSNAAKFTEAGEIELRVSRNTHYSRGNDQICFELSDTGIGMTPEQTVEIFEPFTQADSSSSRRHGGTGLGLAISRRFCQMMDGEISVRSEPNRGSTFIVEIPIKLSEVHGVRAKPN